MKKSIIQNAKLIFHRAQEDYMFSPEEDQNPRLIQAFLLQSCGIEGLMREFAVDLNNKNKIEGMKQPRTFNQACREARVAGGIDKDDFDKLLSYIDFRNTLVHKMLEKEDLQFLEEEINNKYIEGGEIINILT